MERDNKEGISPGSQIAAPTFLQGLRSEAWETFLGPRALAMFKTLSLGVVVGVATGAAVEIAGFSKEAATWAGFITMITAMVAREFGLVGKARSAFGLIRSARR